jgi:two-component system cell cycle response regulator
MQPKRKVPDLNTAEAYERDVCSSPKHKVLIIDDDPAIKAMLEGALSTGEFETRSASGGKRGLTLIKEWGPSVVLLDLVMPGIDGLKVCDKLRAMQLERRPSVIMLSSKDDKKTIVEALSLGADDFIVKPFNEAELAARVRAQIRISDFYSEVAEDKRNLESILAISNAVSETLDPAEVLNIIVNRVAAATGALRCSIVLIAQEDEAYVLATNDDPKINDFKLDLAKYPEIKKVMDTKSPLALDDIVNDPLMSGVKDKIRDLKDMSILLVPIVIQDEVLGTLFLRSRRKESGFAKKEVDFCRIVANASFHAIKNARRFEQVSQEKEQLKKIAITDALTTLYNHDFFYLRLAEEFDRAVRYETRLSLIMMDIDDFKQINDRYGHRAGDNVLKEVAAMIKRGVRKTDIVARYGGEEFAIIMPHNTMEGAIEEAERLRELIASHAYAGLIEETITMSFGVASYPELGVMNSGDFVDQADDALYKAKRSGKNCIRIAESPGK